MPAKTRRRLFVSHDINNRPFGKLPKLAILVSCNKLKKFEIAKIMAVQKQNMPSFASIISVISILFYCAGFLRVELELHKQKKRINALERVTEAKSPSNDAKNKIIRNAPGKCVLCTQKSITWGTIKEYNRQN